MVRSVPMGASFTFRGRMGDVGSAVAAFNPLTAGISAGVNLASTGIMAWMQSIQQSHMADTATTIIVNQLAQQLQNLLNAYLNEPNPSCADQRAALDAYDAAWAWLQSPAGCGNPAYGSAANRCISDRAPGGKYPWQTYYRDPIANDPRMANLGCDTGQSIMLPSLSTGGYQQTGITSTGGSSSTGQTAQQLQAQANAAPAAGASGSTPAPSPMLASTILSGVPDLYVYLAVAALGAMFLLKK